MNQPSVSKMSAIFLLGFLGYCQGVRCCLKCVSLTLTDYDNKAKSLRGTAVLLCKKMFENGQLGRNM
jgi:hypothetical protein